MTRYYTVTYEDIEADDEEEALKEVRNRVAEPTTITYEDEDD